MSKSITQDMACRQSLMKYAEKYGVMDRPPYRGVGGHVKKEMSPSAALQKDSFCIGNITYF